MSEEEKKAIEVLKVLVSWRGQKPEIRDYELEAINTILNLIEKQQKEIEEYKKLVECIEEFKRLKRPVIEIVHEMNKFEDEFISKDKIKEIIGWNIVIKDEKSNNYRPIKNTSAQDVYEAFYKIRELLKERIHE